MTRRIFYALPLLAGCSGEPDEANASPPLDAQAPVQVERPADAPARGPLDVIGATPGPCGSTDATEFLGKRWSGEVAAALKAKSKADAVRVAREMTEEEAAAATSNPRRLNVVLNDSGRIILMDCG